MNKEIAVIIPAYKASYFISDLLRTIYSQTYYNKIKVVIISDDGENYSYNFLYDKFPELDIIILQTPNHHSGPGAARNIGLKYVVQQKIPYIIFADADDIFYSTIAIELLYNSIISENVDMITTPFIQNRNGHISLNYDQIIWLFGKIYKTSIIQNNNITFPETYLGEDQSFNYTYWLYCDGEKEIKSPLYLQKDNDSSLTHNYSLTEYFLLTYNTLYDTFIALKHKKEIYNKLKNNIPERVIRMYLDYNRSYISVGKIGECSFLIKKIYTNIFKEWWLEYTQEDWYKAWQNLGGMSGEIPYIGFMDFLKIMTSEEKDG